MFSINIGDNLGRALCQRWIQEGQGGLLTHFQSKFFLHACHCAVTTAGDNAAFADFSDNMVFIVG